MGFAACARQPAPPAPSNDETLRAQLMALRYDAAEPVPVDPSNRVSGSAAAQRFGQRLFFETALSGPLIESDHDGSATTLGMQGEPQRVSCAGCHVPSSGFVDTRSRHQQASLGARWTMRRTPHLFDLARDALYNWDGRRDSLWSQAIGVFENERELNSGRLFVAEQIFLRHRAEYEALFESMPPLDDAVRFPQLAAQDAGCALLSSGRICRGKPGDGADYDGMTEADRAIVTSVAVNAAKAIAAYVATLRCGPGRFDAWLAGDAAALSEAEVRGAELFSGRAGCIACHRGPLFTDDLFHNVGLKPGLVSVVVRDRDDRGAAAGMEGLQDDPLSTRGAFSDGLRDVEPPALAPELEGAFRTPSLRCVAHQPSFMHTAQLRTLAEVVEFFNLGGHPSGYPGTSEIAPLGLSDDDQTDLVAFMQSLQGPGPGPEALVAPTAYEGDDK